MVDRAVYGMIIGVFFYLNASRAVYGAALKVFSTILEARPYAGNVPDRHENEDNYCPSPVKIICDRLRF